MAIKMVFNPPSLCKLSVEIVKKDHFNHKATIDFFTKPPPYCFHEKSNKNPIKKWDIVSPNNKLEVVKSQLLLEIESYLAEEFYSANPSSY